MKKLFSILTALAITAIILSGCSPSGGDNASPSDGNITTPSDISVTRVNVGNSGGPRPYSFQQDGSENFIGYDWDVLAEIDALLPEYEFDIQVTDFPAIFTGLNSGLFQMGANNITKKPEREAQWLFGKQPYTYNGQVIITRADDTSINGIADLGGKRVYLRGTGLFSDIFADTYNKEHPDNPIIGVPSGVDSVVGFEDLINGVVDFAFSEYWGLKISRQSYPEQFEALRIVTLPDEEARQIEDPLGWYVFPKDDAGARLADAVDGAIVMLRENGTLRELAIKWFGEDGLPEWFEQS
ncbi:MAG: transporter substrate-binding domain-containing protein [Oscillospiraceae bacterium]|jgi:polar amino acid transport system substrate-binding protein|nr:transporter substrate-binding domain-containing protein [Oscillospiraceae bacterium]